MQRTNIYLADRQTEALDKIAADHGVSRAELIRRLIDEGLEGRTHDLTVDLAWIDVSFGAAADIAAPDRRPGAREAHLAQLSEGRR